MSRWRQLALAILIAGAALVWVAHRRQLSQPPAAPSTAGSPGAESRKDRVEPNGPGANSADSVSTQELLPGAIAAAPHMQAASAAPEPPVPETSESASLPPRTILENMRNTIGQYASMLGENPVGTNPEITSALQGDNPRHINFLKEDGNRVNSKGELVDAWGTPYFFHQISGHEMEIRSAGPDRVMYTVDDLVTR